MKPQNHNYNDFPLKIFISPPYKRCPFCGVKSFGICGINSDSYWRRCYRCGKNGNVIKLPGLKKKIIYLDQMAISNMMNSIRLATDKKIKSKIIPEWKIMFEKLDRLVKLQLIICPHSLIHEDESIVTPVFKDLRQMYEHLANGSAFYDIETIIRYQLYVAFMKWLKKDFEEIQVYDIVQGDLDGWQDRIRISINSNRSIADYVEELEKIRNVTSSNLVAVFNRWKTEKTKNFMNWFDEERSAYGPTYWRIYLRSVLANDSASAVNFVLSERSVLIFQLEDILRRSGIATEEEIILKLTDFFRSDNVKEIPYLTIYSMLSAVIANQSAHGGRTKPPNQGTSNDLSFISAFVPYCDALFIDNAFRENIKQGDKFLKLGISNKFYSVNNIKAFFKYLDGIEVNASKAHMDKVKEVYGNNWGQPYLSMYN